MAEQQLHDPSGPVRIVTATSLFDGHDAAINIMRRILQAQGAEVIHLGHNRSVEEIVDAAVQEDVQAVAVSSYQGGHNEFFRYLVDRLRERGCGHIRVYGGGGGVIVASEIDELQGYGVARLFSPEDGARMGLAAMVNQIVADCDHHPLSVGPAVDLDVASTGDSVALARLITAVELDALAPGVTAELRRRAAAVTVPVLGITGTGGSGKSSLTDELILRLRQDQGDKVRLAVVAVDPTRRRTGGALLGDRIRMNAIDSPSVFFRSLATRSAAGEVPEHLDDVVAACKVAGAEVVIVETPGIGQGDGGIIGHVDTSLYVMTPEFGADSQLEKIDMLDLADTVAVNKYDRRGGADAVRAVRRQMARNRELFTVDPEDLPVFGTVAARFNDDGVTALYLHLRDELVGRGLRLEAGAIGPAAGKVSTGTTVVVPPERSRYLAEIAEAIRGFHTETARLSTAARTAQRLEFALDHARAAGVDSGDVDRLAAEAAEAVPPDVRETIEGWDGLVAEYSSSDLARESLSGTLVPRVAVPRFADHGDLVTFVRAENLPGRFPFTAGVFAFKRDDEDPTRMFAGEGDAFRTNRRFHLLSEHAEATRLSTAFDSVTLYGFDPAERPDIYGKVGNAGVSICTLDDMKVLYGGFDLCDPQTSVSMTINGPAPTILAMYLNTVIDQQLDRFTEEHGRAPDHDESAAVAGLGRAHGSGNRPGRRAQGGPGPEHLHPLHRVRAEAHGRHPGVVRRQ